MSNLFNPDFSDFIVALNQHEVEYILIGGYAVILHGYTRTTGDLDIWLNRTPENYEKLVLAFSSFNMPMFDMTKDNFLYNDDFDVFSFGVSPVAIDLISKAKGLDYREAAKQAKNVEIEGLNIRLISLGDLIKMKKAANRAKDLNDIEHLPDPD